MYSQIFTNLVMNSLRHGFADKNAGKILLKAHMDEAGKVLTLEYTDDGCGIEAENLARIYEPFFTTNRLGGNSGLGMSIVYNIVVHKLHGQIRSESRVGEGVRFTMTIPLGP
nr:ATP-binding protein [Anaerotalea alkaliphila]